MRRLFMFIIIFVLLGAIVLAGIYGLPKAEVVRIAGVFLMILIILAIIYLRNRSRRRRLPPPV
jgi:uncharacterized membrane protein YcaP (DUF421 family)